MMALVAALVASWGFAGVVWVRMSPRSWGCWGGAGHPTSPQLLAHKAGKKAGDAGGTHWAPAHQLHLHLPSQQGMRGEDFGDKAIHLPRLKTMAWRETPFPTRTQTHAY